MNGAQTAGLSCLNAPSSRESAGLPGPCADPLATIEACHTRLHALCERLELIADTLPKPAAGAGRVATDLTALLPLHHADEERGLFAILRRKCRGTDETEIVAILDRLSADHADDDATLLEIADYLHLLDAPDALDAPATPSAHSSQERPSQERPHHERPPQERPSQERLSPDAIGYAMRGFFQAKRRHLSLETEIIMPFARKHLAESDVAALGTIMQDNRTRSCNGQCVECKAKLDATLAAIKPLPTPCAPTDSGPDD